jgi:hypothetical protein
MIAVEMSPEQREGVLRHIKAVKALDDDTLLLALNAGYTNPNLDRNDPIVRAEIEGRLLTNIAEGTRELARINEESKVELKRLVDSSLVIERLTKRLVLMTVVLGLLTLALALDVVNKFRLEYFSPLPLPSAPQTPSRPPH